MATDFSGTITIHTVNIYHASGPALQPGLLAATPIAAAPEPEPEPTPVAPVPAIKLEEPEVAAPEPEVVAPEPGVAAPELEVVVPVAVPQPAPVAAPQPDPIAAVDPAVAIPGPQHPGPAGNHDEEPFPNLAAIPRDILIKITTVPVHLQFILDPRCDLWRSQVHCDLLRQLIRHFAPHVFVRIRTTKHEYIRLFYQHVVAEFGEFYGF